MKVSDKIVVGAGENEDLPPGWKKEIKVRKTSTGKKYDRFYTDPVTGYIFRSLKDVQRYLKTGEVGRLAKKPKDSGDNLVMANEDKKVNVSVKVEDREEISETRKSKRPLEGKSESAQRASKRLAGIDIGVPPPLPEPKPRQTTQHSSIKADAPSPPPPPPPPPVEPKTRKATRQAGIKIDSPPPSPPDIRSKRQATRQTGVKAEASAPPPPPVATQQPGNNLDPSMPLPDPKTHQAKSAIPSSTSLSEPKTRRATRQAGIKIDSPPPPPPDSRNSRQATPQAGTQINAVVPVSASSSAEPETSEATRVTRVEIDASTATPPLEPKSSHDTVASPPPPPLVPGMETVASPPPLPEPKTRQAKRPAGSRDIASPPPTKTRKATRLSGIKIDSPPPSLPDTRTNRQSTARHVDVTTSKENDKQGVVEQITNNHHENGDMNGNKQENSIIIPPVSQASNEKDEVKTIENNVLPPTTVNGDFKETKSGNATLPTPEAQQPPPPPPPPPPVAIVPPVNMEKQELPAINPTISNPVPQSNFSLNDLWTDPCIEFAVKTLTGAIPVGDFNKVDSFSPSVPMEDFWTDPCIEFAVKTLTGAISENDYLNHMPATSSNQVLSKHFETGHNNKQQDSMVSKVGNGSLQKSGNLVNGSNGQCSRSWFSP